MWRLVMIMIGSRTMQGSRQIECYLTIWPAYGEAVGRILSYTQ